MATPGELLRLATAAGRAEAEFILTHLMVRSRHELYLDGGQVPDDIESRYRHLLARMAAGEPPQYLVGSAPFLDMDLYVDERCLIPRPETEELVLRAASRVPEPRVIVDFGTGSGCIAIALARRFPAARVIAVDVSPGALDVARKNSEAFGISGTVELLESPNLEHPRLLRLAGQTDLLISNPPYVPSRRMQTLEPRVRDHEPNLSLDGGPKGTKILAMLAERGPAMLAERGLMALEMDPVHADGLLAVLPGATVEQDLSGRPRYIFLRKEQRR